MRQFLCPHGAGYPWRDLKVSDSMEASEYVSAMAKRAPYFREAIFRTVFAEPENLLALFASVAPERAEGLAAADVSRLDVTCIPPWCFDAVVFVAGDNLVIVQDAGSELSDVRLANGTFYVASAVAAYAESKDVNLYGNDPVHLPDTACFVLYSGDDTDRITDGAEIEATLGALSYVSVIRTQGAEPDDIVDQYLAAGVLCDEYADNCDDADEAARKIARACLERGLLPQYFVRDDQAEES